MVGVSRRLESVLKEADSVVHRVCNAVASAGAKTLTDAMPSEAAALAMRMAISPRFAMSSFASGNAGRPGALVARCEDSCARRRDARLCCSDDMIAANLRKTSRLG